MSPLQAKPIIKRPILLGLILLISFFSELSAAQPTFTKVFTPDTIGPGSVSTITFTITNGGGPPVTDLAFTDVLPIMPGPMTIADPANASTTCDIAIGGTGVVAPDGGGTISLGGGQLSGGQSCVITVDVTASTPGVYTNPAITLDSSAGSSMSLAANLTVTADRPGFSKSFAPSTIPLGDRSTLTFIIDNTASGVPVFDLNFTDNLPVGMIIADPANAFTDCINSGQPDTTLIATPGTSIITIDANGAFILLPLPSTTFNVLSAGATCTVTVDITATGGSMLDNITSELTTDLGSSGKASATLDVTITPLALQKSFTNDPVPPGGTVTLDFTIDNFDRNFSATGIAFNDSLEMALMGLAPSGALPAAPCNGTGSLSFVTGTLSFTGGSLAPESSCTFSVTLLVPASTTPGIFPNTTGAITAIIDSSLVGGNMASDDLFVAPIPLLTKVFMDNPVNPGDTTVLEFTVTNTSTTSSATDVAFSDSFNSVLATASVTPGNGCCGAGSICTFTPLFNPPLDLVVPAQLAISGGTLAPAGMAGDSCTFAITLDVGIDAAAGLYPNITSTITATVDGDTRTGSPASDTLAIIAAPSLTKVFTNNPVIPGGTTTLEFTLTHSVEAPSAATGITFTDNLDSVITGLAAVGGLPLIDPCGTGSMLTGSAGDTLLTLMGGNLSPGSSCTFSVNLDVPAGAAPGGHVNTTSGVGATVGGLAVASAPAADTLNVAGLTFSKAFISDQVIPGETSTLRFTIENTSPTDDATAIVFTDQLSDVLPGNILELIPTLPPTTDTCGGTPVLIGSSLFVYSGGSLASSNICTIEFDVMIPAGVVNGTYINTTSALSASQGGSTVFINPATAALTINDNLLQLSKVFTDDPVAPGDTATLEFTLTNLDDAQAASAIAFTDNLGAVVAGLTFTNGPFAACGGMITTPDAGVTLDFAGGSLTPGEVCMFSVSVAVPPAAAASIYTNTTSQITGTIGVLAVTGDAASDDLVVVDLIDFSKSFNGPSTATATSTLTFTLINAGTNAGDSLIFSDDLDSVITGLVATNLPLNDICGLGSSITGTSLLTFTAGNLPPSGGMCSFEVEVAVPASASPGTFPNITSDLTQQGLQVDDPATADLVIEPAPTFAKVFAPSGIGIGLVSTLTFTIDNSASALAASSLDFTDNLPVGVVIASPTNAATTCTGGTLTAASASSVISYTGGSVAAASSCTIDVDVTANTSADYVNTTGDLTSSSGNSGTATDTLTVVAAPTFAKVFAPSVTIIGGTSTLTFTIDNSASSIAASNLDFTDNLPAAMLIATPSNAATTCSGGILTAVAGSDTITYTWGTVNASSTCTITVDTTSNTVGAHVNTSSDLTSTTGNSGTASDTLTIVPTPLFSKAFTPANIAAGATSTLIFTINNNASILLASSLDFTDNLPAGVTVATPSNATTTCTGGTLTAVDGSGVITYTGGTVSASSTCTLSVDTTSSTLGAHVNTTGNLTSSNGNSGAASDTLLVAPPSLFSKEFMPDIVDAGIVSTLTFIIDNSASVIAADALDFTDNFPPEIIIASPSNAATTCTGGTLTAISGASVISYTGGSVAGGATCTIDVDITSNVLGTFTNITGDLTSTLGNSGSASTSLEVVLAEPIPTLDFWALLLLSLSMIGVYRLNSRAYFK